MLNNWANDYVRKEIYFCGELKRPHTHSHTPIHNGNKFKRTHGQKWTHHVHTDMTHSMTCTHRHRHTKKHKYWHTHTHTHTLPHYLGRGGHLPSAAAAAQWPDQRNPLMSEIFLLLKINLLPLAIKQPAASAATLHVTFIWRGWVCLRSAGPTVVVLMT